jgi:hypothetical protein
MNRKSTQRREATGVNIEVTISLLISMKKIFTTKIRYNLLLQRFLAGYSFAKAAKRTGRPNWQHLSNRE